MAQGTQQVDLTSVVAGAQELIAAGIGAPVDRRQRGRLRREPQRRGGRTSMAAAPMADRRGAHGAATADGGRPHGAAAHGVAATDWI
jgi:hypothetical protein